MNNTNAEIDILVRTSNEIIIYECKGKNQIIYGAEIVKWKDKIANCSSRSEKFVLASLTDPPQ